MIMKLSPQILDAMNIFVIEIEELDLPKVKFIQFH